MITSEVKTPSLNERLRCHWCRSETWNANRVFVEVFDLASNKMKSVSAHSECQMKRERQVASIPFDVADNNSLRCKCNADGVFHGGGTRLGIPDC